jgi:hypothetical protein
MLVTAVVDAIMGILSSVWDVLPIGTNASTNCLGLGLNCQAQSITSSSQWPQLGWLNNYLPLDQMVLAAQLLITTVLVTLVIRIGIYLWNLLPIGGSN